MTKDIQKSLRVGLIIAFFIFILIYGFYRSYDLMFGVKIKNVNIENGQTYTESILTVSGNAKNATKLMLNGREISLDKDGNFSEAIALLLGYNIVGIEAKDKFGHIDEKYYQLIYKKNEKERQ